MPMHAAFVNDLHSARRMGSKGKKLRQQARHDALLSDDDRRRIDAEGKRLLNESDHVRTAANTMGSKIMQRRRAQLSHAFMNARRVDPSALATLVMADLTLPDPLNLEPRDAIPQADGQPPPLDLFYKYFRGITQEKRLELVPGATNYRRFWRDRIPQAPEDPSLTARVCWELIYCIVFPPTKRLIPPRCCDGPCAICDLMSLEWHAWKPHDRLCPVPPPVFKPSLRTSRASGPDGLRSEDWRWAGHGPRTLTIGSPIANSYLPSSPPTSIASLRRDECLMVISRCVYPPQSSKRANPGSPSPTPHCRRTTATSLLAIYLLSSSP